VDRGGVAGKQVVVGPKHTPGVIGARAIHLMNGDVIPHAFLEQQLAACNDPNCRIDVARLAGADFVLVVTGKHDQQSFDLTTEIWDGGTTRSVGSASKRCDLCTLKELYDAAEDQAASLVTGARNAAKQRTPTTAASRTATGYGWMARGVMPGSTRVRPAAGRSR